MIRALGPVDVLVDGATAPRELLWRHPLVLLLYLARSPRRTRTREHLVGLLWPEKPSDKAHHSLNVALDTIRACAGRALVGRVGDQVRLNAAQLDLDTDRFDPLVAERRWAEACDLIGGSFLEGFVMPGASGVEDWLKSERDLWARKAVDALVQHVAQLLEAGDLKRAAERAQQAAAIDPLSDAAACALMRSLALAGLRSEALVAYERFSERLAQDLGTHPDASSAALAERVRQGRVWRRAAAPAAQAGTSRRTPLVGRARELARLQRVWQACRTEHRAALALVCGDPGMGKSRLAEELLERARLDGAAVATTRAVEADITDAWSGILALAEGGLLEAPGVAAASPAALGAFAACLPAWAERFPEAPPLPPRGEGGAMTLGRALREVMRAVCGEQPCVLVLDDAQWLDRESLLACAALIRDLRALPCFLVLTTPSVPGRVELDGMRARLGREVRGAVVRLAALGREDLRVLARWALPHYDEGQIDRVVRRVATDSAGLPLLAVELLHAVALGLELGKLAGAWPEPLRTLDQTLPGGFPDAVVGAIRVNYRRLSNDARTVLAAAAVLSGRVRAEQLRRATGLGLDAVQVALDELEWQRWLTAESRGYAFVARIVGEIVARDQVEEGQRLRIREAVT
jgi:DNA-binding SARP family transcriptional activator